MNAPSVKKTTAVFYGVGVGPGDPELLTLKALRVLKESPVLAVPRSAAGADSLSQALTIVKGALDVTGKEILELAFPMTRDRETLHAARETASNEIVKRLSVGRGVAFITLGDPMFYSTFSYVMAMVRKAMPSVEIKVVPGINSFSAAASLARTAIAEADESVAIIPATYNKDGLMDVLKNFDTVIIMKVNRTFAALIDTLTSAGLVECAFLVSRAGWKDEAIVTDIRGMLGLKLDYFTTVIVKKKGFYRHE